jgi:hypothetical protein
MYDGSWSDSPVDECGWCGWAVAALHVATVVIYVLVQVRHDHRSDWNIAVLVCVAVIHALSAFVWVYIRLAGFRDLHAKRLFVTILAIATATVDIINLVNFVFVYVKGAHRVSIGGDILLPVAILLLAAVQFTLMFRAIGVDHTKVEAGLRKRAPATPATGMALTIYHDRGSPWQ